MSYRNLYYRQTHSYGDILRIFDKNWTSVIDFVCLLSSTPKISIFHTVFQMSWVLIWHFYTKKVTSVQFRTVTIPIGFTGI